MESHDDSARLIEAVHEAAANETPLVISGSASKAFLGPVAEGALLLTGEHRGVVDYHPEELVLTARSGSPLDEVRRLLDEQRQMLPFDPPLFGGDGTLGGAVATALAGPGRPWYGGVRDAVLGVEIVNGRGERLRFGGQVMKNVAGYDLSRLMAGAFGTLGVLLSVSLRVVPKPEIELTRVFELGRDAALQRQVDLGREPEPLTATWHEGERLYVRLSGSLAGVNAAARRLGGVDDPEHGAIWARVRDHDHPAFQTRLWRFSLPAAAPYPFDADWLTEWGGRQRWASVALPPQQVWRIAAALGGHATLYGEGAAFQPLGQALLAYHRRVKQALDPARILNRGRLYPEL
jgi:glycolate oxidase FAD binding subunit